MSKVKAHTKTTTYRTGHNDTETDRQGRDTETGRKTETERQRNRNKNRQIEGRVKGDRERRRKHC